MYVRYNAMIYSPDMTHDEDRSFPVPPEDDPRFAIDRFCEPTCMRGDDVLKELLRYLAKHSYPDNRPNSRIGGVILKSVGGSDVAHSISRLHQKLKDYYAGDGIDDPQILTVHAGGRGSIKRGDNYKVEVKNRRTSFSRLFWQPHLKGDKPVVLATNAPLFFRHQDGTHRVRVMAVNDQNSLDNHTKKRRSPVLSECELCFHYISIGDFRLSVALTKFFLLARVHPESKVVYASRELHDDYNPPDSLELAKTNNIVAFGNPRVSWVVKKLQERISPNFHIASGDQTSITNRFLKREAAEKKSYQDDLQPNGNLYGAVIRRKTSSRVETLILVQNGPALEAIADILTDDSKLEAIVSKTGWEDMFPESFELLFHITLGQKEEVIRPGSGPAPGLVAWR